MAVKAQKRSLEDMREAAIGEARQMMAEGGPDKVQARLLAVRLGVSVGTVYNLFGQLEELLFHVNASAYDELMVAVNTDLDDARAKGAATVDLMLCLSRTYLHFVVANQDLWAGVLAFNRRGKSRVPDWYRQKERAVFDIVRTTVSGLSDNLEPDRLALAAAALWAAVHGIVTVSVGRDGLLATEDEVWTQIELVVRSVATELGA